MIRNCLFGLLLAAQIMVVNASESASGPKWSGKAALGLVTSSGNANTRSLTIRADLARQHGRWRQDFVIDVHRAEAEAVETADRRLLGYKLSREIDTRRYTWGLIRYESDTFADIHQRDIVAFGFGYRLLVGPTHKLNVEVGGGYRKTRFVANNRTSHDRPVTLGLLYTGQLTESTRFSQTFSVEHSREDVQYQSTSDLNVKINSRLSLSLVATIRHNEDVPGALGKMTDTLTTVNLVYSF